MTASRVYGYDNVSYRFDSYLLYIKGEANDYIIIIIYYYVVHQSTYSIVVIVVGYQPCVRIAMAIDMACY